MHQSGNFSEQDTALLELAQLLQVSSYGFTTTTPATHARINARSENAIAKDVRGVFGWSRPFRPEVLPGDAWQLAQRANIAIPHGELWKSTLRLSSLQGAFFWHSAYPTIEADSVFFGPDTYRFGSAISAFFASNTRPIRRAVDVGCGAGPGAILVAMQNPAASVSGVDINPTALRLARINATLNGVPHMEPLESNLLTAVEGDFDLIVSNPPYLVDTSERAYRHGGGPLGAGLSLAIVEAALNRLSQGGTLLLYTGAAIVDGQDPFKEAVASRLDAHDLTWSYQEMDPDIFGEELECPAYSHTDRIAAVVLTAQKHS